MGSALSKLPTRPTVHHEPVLVGEVIGTLAPAAGQTLVDCTFGAGGHARRLAPLLGRSARTSRSTATDRPSSTSPRSPSASTATRASSGPTSPTRCACSRDEDVHVDGILMDLGISSMQVDQPERGFSYSRNAPLDMRMDPTQPRTAADVLAEASEEELAGWFKTYGEERYARPIARAIVRQRAKAPLVSTCELVELIRGAIPTPALFAGGTRPSGSSRRFASS